MWVIFLQKNPNILVYVVIHRPNKSKGYYGATVAAPVFKEVAKKIYNDIPHQVKIKLTDLNSLIETSNKFNSKTVPDVAGMSKNVARITLEKMGFTVVLRGEGVVKSQSIPPGEKFKKRQKIILDLI